MNQDQLNYEALISRIEELRDQNRTATRMCDELAQEARNEFGDYIRYNTQARAYKNIADELQDILNDFGRGE